MPRRITLKLVKVPGPTRLLFGCAIAYWLSHIINPAFVSIAVMIVLFIPVFIADYSYDSSIHVENQVKATVDKKFPTLAQDYHHYQHHQPHPHPRLQEQEQEQEQKLLPK